MNEKIIQMARDASGGTQWWPIGSDVLERFAAAIRAATKDEDAKIADSFYQHIRQYTTDVPDIGAAILVSK